METTAFVTGQNARGDSEMIETEPLFGRDEDEV